MGYIGNNSISSQNVQPATDFFSGNGVTTSFTLTRQVISAFTIEAVINNVQQNPSSAYTVSGNTITFTSAPPSGTNNIYVNYNSLVGQQVGIGQGTVGTSQLAAITNIFSGVNNLTLQTGGNNTTALTVDQNQNVGLGGTPGTYNLNPRLFVNSPWSTPAAPGAYGGIFVANNDTLSADKGGVISLGGPYDTSGTYTRFAAIAGNKNNATNNDYGGYLAFYTRANGASPAENMRINSAGYVTIPNQPMFFVWSDLYTPQKTYGSQVTLNTANSNGLNITTNNGGFFNATTGLFTAPIDGWYAFAGSFSRSNGNAILDLFKNGGSVGVRHLSYGADWQTVTVSAVLRMVANDNVNLSFGGTNGTTTSGYRIHFQGQLVG
jgi:hypothetical protein